MTSSSSVEERDYTLKLLKSELLRVEGGYSNVV
jgi:hypothetical protein